MKEKLMKVICLILFAYLFGCYIEIICKNSAPNPKYSSFNVIVSAFDKGAE